MASAIEAGVSPIPPEHAIPPPKIPVVRVELLWSENPLFQRRFHSVAPEEPPSWPTLAAANAFLSEMAKEAPEFGFDVTGFRVTWKDGMAHQGQYALHRDLQENANGRVDLGDFLRGIATFLTGDYKPRHLTDSQYAACLSTCGMTEMKRERCRDFVAKYEM